MRVKGGKAGLKLAFFLKKKRKKVMASGPIISWQIEGGKVETAFLSSKITVDADCSQKLKTLASQKKSYDNLDSVLKSRDTTLQTKVYVLKVILFPVYL